MNYLVVLVFGAGLLGLAFMLLSFVMRFFLLTWGVRLVGGTVQSMLRFAKELIYALIFVFGTAILGAFLIALGLQLAFTYAAGGENADPTMPVLWGLLALFVIVAVRGLQWRARRNRRKADGEPFGKVSEAPEPPDYPAGYEHVADAWDRAIKLAPKYRNDLSEARATCAYLVNAVEHHGDIPDSAMIDTAALIRNNLAPLVDSTERRLRGAKHADRAEAIAETVKFLIGFAARAQQDMQGEGFARSDADSALRAHLATQLFG